MSRASTRVPMDVSTEQLPKHLNIVGHLNFRTSIRLPNNGSFLNHLLADNFAPLRRISYIILSSLRQCLLIVLARKKASSITTKPPALLVV